MEIKVWGQDCSYCKKLFYSATEALADLNLSAEVEWVEDVKEILSHGVMSSPAMVVNGKVKVAGRVPSRAVLRKMFEEEK
jgi:small redox-active disulfide protein 2